MNSYFLYKRYVEDPFFGLARRYPYLFADGNIIDLGAGFGYNSIIFSQVISPGYKVYAFEPDELNFIVLKEVLWRKGAYRKVVVVKAATGEKDANVIFLHNSKCLGDNRVLTDTLPQVAVDLMQKSRVQMYSIDSFVASKIDTKNVKFIKIDVPGI